MSTIGSANAGYVPPPPIGGSGTDVPPDLRNPLNLITILGKHQAWGPAGLSGNTVTNTPMLEKPGNLAEIMLMIMGSQDETSKLGMKVSLEMYQTSNLKKDVAQAEGKRLMAAAKAAFDAAKSAEEETKRNGWITSSLGLAAAVIGVGLAAALTVGTAGAGAVVLAVAVVGLVMAVGDMTNRVLEDQGVTVTGADGKEKPMDVTIFGLVDSIADALLVSGAIEIVTERPDGSYVDKHNNVIDKSQSRYVTQSEFDEAKSTSKIVLMAVIMVTMLVAGGFGAHQLGKAVTLAGNVAGGLVKTGANIERLANLLNALTQVAGGSTSVYEGVRAVGLAELRQNMERANADKKLQDVIVKQALMQMRLDQEFLATIEKIWNENGANWSDALAELGRSDHVRSERN